MSQDSDLTADPTGDGTTAGSEADPLGELLAFIAESRSIDFSGYKRASLTRRITKRMADVGADTFDDYRDLLETNADEFAFLLDTVLINVTGFFRDPNAWELLRTEVVPDIVQRAGTDEIRVWSAGCSSGEEAYSLAISFAEAMGVDAFREQVKIYATDIDDAALRHARQGTYPAKALAGVSPEVLERYFESNDTSYTFSSDLRRKVIFGRHDVTTDAPISRLHLLTCRNTLMYFNAEVQSRIVDRFHYALEDDGFLFLGKAEMLLSDAKRFEALSVPNRIFRRRPGERTYGARPPVASPEPAQSGTSLRHRQLRDVALDVDPVAHVVVDVNGSVVLVNNQARAMFGMTSRDEGRPLRDLEISYRPVELRSLIEQAHAERRVVRLTGVERSLGPGDRQYFDVQVQPLLSDDGVVLGVGITFTDTTPLVRMQDEFRRTSQELETAYEELQSTNEELETTNEELQSSIEELETTNEELQSTNEELETTNEELQSSNEELETMNEELRSRTGDLDEVAEYLDSILASLPTAIVVLDASLVVQSWNQRAQDLWGLRRDEVVGVPFFGLDFGLPAGRLREGVRHARVDGGSSELVLDAVNRLGRAVSCHVTVSPLGPGTAGVVLSMEEVTEG